MMVKGKNKECQHVEKKVNFPPCDPMRERENPDLTNHVPDKVSTRISKISNLSSLSKNYITFPHNYSRMWSVDLIRRIKGCIGFFLIDFISIKYKFRKSPQKDDTNVPLKTNGSELDRYSSKAMHDYIGLNK